MTTFKKTGLIIGKFMPLHKGHEFLIKFANNYVDHLVVLVDHFENETISAELRAKWVGEVFQKVEVIKIEEITPQHPNDSENFWDNWKVIIEKHVPYKLNYIFASEDYGLKLSELLQCKFIPVNIGRNIIPVSGTEIRDDIYKFWKYLSDPVKKHYVKKIYIVGPECSGKTTLVDALVNKLYITKVFEYAIEYIDVHGKDLLEEDLVNIIRGQQSLERETTCLSEGVIISDTDQITTSIWSKMLFSKDLEEYIDMSMFDNSIYLLLDFQIDWEENKYRYFKDKRLLFFNELKSNLERYNLKYHVVSGSKNQRVEQALQLIEEFIRK